MKAPRSAPALTVRDGVAGTVPLTSAGTLVLRKNVVGFSVGFTVPNSHCWKN